MLFVIDVYTPLVTPSHIWNVHENKYCCISEFGPSTLRLEENYASGSPNSLSTILYYTRTF